MTNQSLRSPVLAVCVIAGTLAVSGSAHAQTPFQHQGLDSFHPTDSAMPNEQVDPSSGTLTVVATDLVLPGNAGFNLAITRVYNSSVFRDYDSGSTALEERSWAGVGWRLHFGRILHADSQTAGQMQIEMGDGSRHALYHSQGNPNIWTTADFWLYNPATNVLQLPNGVVYTFGRAVVLDSQITGGFGTVRYVTDIRDPFGNDLSFTYFDGTNGPLDGVQSIHQIVSATEARDVTFTVDATLHALASMTYLNHTWSYTQSGTGPSGYPLLVTVHPPLGPSTVYDYGGVAGGELTAIHAPWGGTIAYTYQDATRVASTLATKTRVVATRTMSGHDVTTGTWTFAYGAGANQDSTVISCPCGGTTTYRFNGTGLSGSFAGWSAGTVAEITIKDGPTTVDDRTMTWIQSEAISPDPVNGPNGIWSDAAVYKPLLQQQTITRGYDTYTTMHTYHTGLGTMNDYGQPYYTEETGSNIYVWRHTTRTFQGGFTPYIVGRLASVTAQENSAYNQPDGSSTSSSTYDPATGFLTSHTARGITTTFEPRSDGNVGAVVDARGNRTTFGYDWGVVNDVHTPNTHSTSVITPEGLVASQTQVGDQSTGNPTTSYAYDYALRLVSVTPPTGNATTVVPDDLHGTYVRMYRGSSMIEHDVDAFGREIKTFNSQGLQRNLAWDLCGHQTFDGDPWTATWTGQGRTMVYDVLGRVTQVTDAAGHVTRLAYGGMADVTRTDANNHATTYEYIGFGDPGSTRLWRVTDARGGVTTYRYDITGALTQVTGPLAGVTRSWVVSNGLVASDTQPESGTTTYTYDPIGNLATVTNANNQQTTFTYDTDNRLTLRDAPGTDDDLTTTYDALGRTKTLAGGGTTTTFTYDLPNRHVTRQDVTTAGTFSSVYTTDANGNLQQVAYPSGRLVSYAYDAENRLTSITHTPPGAQSSSVFASGFTYGDGGQLASYVTGAVTHQFTYEFGRPKRLYTTGGTDALDLTYTYDNAGNITQIADPRANATQTFITDPLDRLTQANGPWGTLTWSYDAAGNRLSETTVAGTTTYNYNASTQRLTSMAGVANETFTYDNVGQLTSDGVVSQYTYSPTGKLKAATAPPVTASYVYDVAGERFSKTVNGRTTYSIRGGGGEVLSEYLDSCGSVTWARDLVYVGGQLIGAAKAAATQPTVAFVSEPLAFAESAGNATVHVVLTTPGGTALTCPVVVNYATTPGTASATLDYTPKSGTLTFAAGAASGSTQAITIPIINDTLNEDNETFSVGLTSVTGATLGAAGTATVTILDDDPLPGISIGNTSVIEGTGANSTLHFTVSLSAASGRTVTVGFATADRSATAGSDYLATSGTLTFAPGITTQTVSVVVIGDSVPEPNEVVAIVLSNPTNATIVRPAANGLIIDDDGGTPGPKDFNHDGQADLVWRYAPTGDLVLWHMSGVTMGSVASLTPISALQDPNWQVRAVGDFNNDGYPDLVWQNVVTGALALWCMNDNSEVATPSLTTLNGSSTAPGLMWQIVGAADMDLDGQLDLVWQNTQTGALLIWHMSGLMQLDSVPLSLSPGDSAWAVVGVADLDRDGRPDLVFRNTSTGALATWLMNDATVVTTQWLTPDVNSDLNWKIVGVVDMNGDGWPDLVWQNTANGELAAWYLQGTTTIGTPYLSPWQVTDLGWRIVGVR